MKKKYYTPIIKSDEHLVKSKDNPTRVRGVSLDSDNKNVDIPEWEEHETDTTKEALAYALIGAAVAKGIDLAHDAVTNTVWWQNKVIPWKTGKINDVKGFLNEKLGTKFKMDDIPLPTTEKTIDYAKDEIEKEMIMVTQDEFEEHLINYIDLFLALNNEAYFLKNAEITDNDNETAKNEIIKETFSSINDILKKKGITLSDYSIREIENATACTVDYSNGTLSLKEENKNELKTSITEPFK